MSSLKKWSKDSFMIEMRPTCDSANLFISCPEGPCKEAVKVTRNGASVGTLREDHKDLDPSKSSSIVVSGIRFLPESVSNCVWADNETLFTCRAQFQAEHHQLDRRSNEELARKLKGEMSADDFCSALRKSSPSISCGRCSEPLIDEDVAKKVTGAYCLPSDHWEELLGEPSLFCCGDAGGAPSEAFGWTPEDLLLTDSYFLLQPSLFRCRVDVSSDSVLSCSHCLSELGFSVKKFGREMYKFFHSHTTLRCHSTDRLSFIELRFKSEENYFAWLILSESHAQSTLKFVVKSLTSTPRALIWLMDSYSLLAIGTMQEKASESEQPFAAVKILFKLYGDAETDDPRLNGGDFSVGSIQQPEDTCLALVQLLLDSSHTLPPTYRSLGQFNVGYLKI